MTQLEQQIRDAVDMFPFSSDISPDEGTFIHHTWKFTNPYDPSAQSTEFTDAISDELFTHILEKILQLLLKREGAIDLNLEKFDFTNAIDGSNNIYDIIAIETESTETMFVTPFLLSILQSATHSKYVLSSEEDSNKYKSFAVRYCGKLITESHIRKVFYIITSCGMGGIAFNQDDIKVKIHSIDVKEHPDEWILSVEYYISVADNVKVFT